MTTHSRRDFLTNVGTATSAAALAHCLPVARLKAKIEAWRPVGK